MFALPHILVDALRANASQQYFEIRSKKIAALQASQDPNPYPHKFHTNYRIADYVRDYAHLKKGETEPDKEIRMGLRVMTKRSASSSLHFYVCTYMLQDITFRCLTVDRQGRGHHHSGHVPIARVQGRRAL